ncbi:MAG: AAA family ATPase [Thermodesulfobacteriota bacterium]
MYSKHFNLTENPFSIAPDPRYLYMSEKHREALAHLMYGLKTHGGFVLLTGEVGTGKTTVCRCLLEQLPNDLNVAFVLNPRLTAEELLATVCDELRIDYREDNNSIKELVDNINRYLLDAHAGGRKTVLIIDEAQNLSPEVLEQVRLLTNLETNQQKLLQIIMLGQPELRDQLARPELRQLAQRITARYHLGPLNKNEIAPYINHRLAVAGHHKKLFPDNVVSRIYSLTNGIPRLINVICDRALLGTYVEGREQVNRPTLKKAAQEVFGNSNRKSSATIKWLIPALFVLSLGLALFFHNWTKDPAESITPKISSTAANTGEQTPTGSGTRALEWPADIPHARSLPTAFTVLFSRWGATYDQDSGLPPCRQAEAQGLACLDRQGSLGSLRHLNRPAVLRLIDDQGRTFYAPIINLAGNTALLEINSREIAVNTTDLEKQWFGGYTVLWQPPPGGSREIKTGETGQDAEWLIENLEKQTGLQAAYMELDQMITSYQKKEGLIADGIAGPETLIHLNLSIGRSGPALVEK